MPRLDPVVATLRAAAARLRLLAALSTLAALWLWAVPLAAYRLPPPWALGLALSALALFLVPAVVLLLTAVALARIAALPAEVLATRERGAKHVEALKAPDGASGRARKTWRVGWKLYAIWRFLAERKGLLLQYGALAKLANPVALAVVGAAAAAAGGLIAASVLIAAWMGLQ